MVPGSSSYWLAGCRGQGAKRCAPAVLPVGELCNVRASRASETRRCCSKLRLERWLSVLVDGRRDEGSRQAATEKADRMSGRTEQRGPNAAPLAAPVGGRCRSKIPSRVANFVWRRALSHRLLFLHACSGGAPSERVSSAASSSPKLEPTARAAYAPLLFHLGS